MLELASFPYIPPAFWRRFFSPFGGILIWTRSRFRRYVEAKDPGRTTDGPHFHGWPTFSCHESQKGIPTGFPHRKWTNIPWKLRVGKCISYWQGRPFFGDDLRWVFRAVALQMIAVFMVHLSARENTWFYTPPKTNSKRTWTWGLPQKETIIFQSSIFRYYISFRQCVFNFTVSYFVIFIHEIYLPENYHDIGKITIVNRIPTSSSMVDFSSQSC